VITLCSSMSLITNKRLLDQLSRSEIYKGYERAFGETTGLPLSLRTAEDFSLAHRGKSRENPFCALMAKHNRTCAACLDAQQRARTPRFNMREPSCASRGCANRVCL
jgi:hypothetical protein